MISTSTNLKLLINNFICFFLLKDHRNRTMTGCCNVQEHWQPLWNLRIILVNLWHILLSNYICQDTFSRNSPCINFKYISYHLYWDTKFWKMHTCHILYLLNLVIAMQTMIGDSLYNLSKYKFDDHFKTLLSWSIQLSIVTTSRGNKL